MSNPVRKAATLFLTAALAVCWVVGEAWHLMPGMSHVEEHCCGHLLVGAAPTTVLSAPCECRHGGFQKYVECPLPILAIGESPVSRLISQNFALCSEVAFSQLPALTQRLPAVACEFYGEAAIYIAAPRAPPC